MSSLRVRPCELTPGTSSTHPIPPSIALLNNSRVARLHWLLLVEGNAYPTAVLIVRKQARTLKIIRNPQAAEGGVTKQPAGVKARERGPDSSPAPALIARQSSCEPERGLNAVAPIADVCDDRISAPWPLPKRRPASGHEEEQAIHREGRGCAERAGDSGLAVDRRTRRRASANGGAAVHPTRPLQANCGSATTAAKRISRPTKPTMRKNAKFIPTAPAASVVT